MPQVVAVLNSKGGSGKTTLATNLAGCLHKRGYAVLLVDSDPQGTARDWGHARPEGVDLPSVIGIDRPTLEKDIPAVASPFDFIVLDGAAKLERMTASAVKAADMVLIPVKHSGFDLWAVESLVESILTRQQLTGGKPLAAFVVSSQSQGSRLARSIDDALDGLGLPVFQSRTSLRVAYEEAGGAGLTVLDLEGRDKATEEIEAITSELLHTINHVQVQA